MILFLSLSDISEPKIIPCKAEGTNLCIPNRSVTILTSSSVDQPASFEPNNFCGSLPLDMSRKSALGAFLEYFTSSMSLSFIYTLLGAFSNASLLYIIQYPRLIEAYKAHIIPTQGFLLNENMPTLSLQETYFSKAIFTFSTECLFPGNIFSKICKEFIKSCPSKKHS